MSPSLCLLLVSLDALKLGVPVAVVEGVVRAAEITPLSQGPTAVAGIINFHGEILPVVDLRSRFRLAAKALAAEDHFVIVRLARRALAIAVDEATDVLEFDRERLLPAADLLPWLEGIQGVLRLEDGLLIVNDPDRFLDIDDWDALSSIAESDA